MQYVTPLRSLLDVGLPCLKQELLLMHDLPREFSWLRVMYGGQWRFSQVAKDAWEHFNYSWTIIILRFIGPEEQLQTNIYTKGIQCADNI